MEEPGLEPALEHARLDLGWVVAGAVLEFAHRPAESRSRRFGGSVSKITNIVCDV
jgi:hypothetical protein